MTKMALFMMVNGMKIRKVVEVKCFSQMALFMMASGIVIKCTGQVCSSHAPEIGMKAISLMELSLALAPYSISMVTLTQANGETIPSRVKENSPLRMETSMRVILQMAYLKALERWYSWVLVLIEGISMLEICKVKVDLITWMGLTMKVTTKKIKSMDKAFLLNLKDALFTMVSGNSIRKMVKVFFYQIAFTRSKDFGNLASYRRCKNSKLQLHSDLHI